MGSKHSVINRDNSTIRTSNSTIDGWRNTIIGSNNKIFGGFNTVNGDNNKICGANNEIRGNNNIMQGEGNMARGDGNVSRQWVDDEVKEVKKVEDRKSTRHKEPSAPEQNYMPKVPRQMDPFDRYISGYTNKLDNNINSFINNINNNIDNNINRLNEDTKNSIDRLNRDMGVSVATTAVGGDNYWIQRHDRDLLDPFGSMLNGGPRPSAPPAEELPDRYQSNRGRRRGQMLFGPPHARRNEQDRPREVVRTEVVYVERKVEKKLELEEKPDQEAEEDSHQCTICLTNKKCVLYAPCNHVASCNECAQKILKGTKQCPLCREEVKAMTHIYI